MVWRIQLELFIQPFLPCGYIVCLVMVAAGGYYSAGVLRGASKGRGELYSSMVGGSLSLVEGSLGSDGCYGREWWPGSMPGEEGGTAAATRTGTTHNAQHFTYCAHGRTQRHTESSTQFGGGSVAAAVHQLAAYMSDQTRRQLTNIGKDKHILVE